MVGRPTGTRQRRAPLCGALRALSTFNIGARVCVAQEQEGRPKSWPKASLHPSASPELGFNSQGRNGAELRAQEGLVTCVRPRAVFVFHVQTEEPIKVGT